MTAGFFSLARAESKLNPPERGDRIVLFFFLFYFAFSKRELCEFCLLFFCALRTPFVNFPEI